MKTQEFGTNFIIAGEISKVIWKRFYEFTSCNNQIHAFMFNLEQSWIYPLELIDK